MSDWGYCTDCDASVETYTRLVIKNSGCFLVHYCDRCDHEVRRISGVVDYV